MITSTSTSSCPAEVHRLSGLSAIWQLLQFSRNPLDFSIKSAQEYGDVVKISVGSSHAYLFHHPDLIAEVLSKQNQHFIKDFSYRALAGIFGNGLLLSDGDLWQRHRRLMQPAFTQERISSYAATIVEDTAYMLSTWKNGETRDIYQEISHLTVKVITKVLFGVDVTQIALKVGDSLEAVMRQFYHRAQTNFLLPSWMPTPSNLRGNQALKHLNKTVAAIIEQRRHSPQDDLLSSLLLAQDEDGSQLTMDELRDEVMTLLLAGHDTTVNALTWTLMLLAQHPVVAAKLKSETQSVLEGKFPDITDLSRLPYTEMVLKESMRLYPPAWALSREVSQDCMIGPYALKKGATIFFSQWVVHRDARFFDDPEQFLPERWQDNLEQKLPRCAYFPFGAGPRACIGKVFSMMEAKLMLAMISKQYCLMLVPDQTIELLPSITLRPKHGIKMVLESSSF
ncbi:cytochrome P450 [Acaryochloris marina NIES-2412]|uniref:cytochrome P450 n=1 Tax=Acaryochloris marina TaxID=155978 RepID=UPI004059E93F